MENTTDAGSQSDNAATTVLATSTEVADNTTTQTAQTVVTDNSPASKFNDLLDSDGKFLNEWTTKLPEGLKDSAKTLAKFKDPTALLTSYAHLEKEFSKKANAPTVKLPGDDATDEDWNKYREAVGAPAKKEDYALVKPENLSDEQWNSSLADKAASVALKYGIPKKALHELADTYNSSMKDMVANAETQQQQMYDSAISEIKKEWGAEWTSNIQKGQRAAAAIGLDINDPNIGNNIAVIKALVKVDNLLGEDNTRINAANTVSTYRETYDKLTRSDDYMGKNGVQKQLAVAERIKELYKAMNPQTT